MDEQRMSRLEQCAILQGLLQDCRTRHACEQPPKDGSNHRKRSGWWSKFGQNTTTSTATTPDLNDDDHLHVDTIETVPAGIRMLRYFDWRHLGHPKPTAIGSTETTTVEKHTTPTSTESLEQAQKLVATCRREEHAVWACRAIALKCGGELSQVRTCFQSLPGAPTQILHYPTQYEGNDDSDPSLQVPCITVQKALASCVAKQATALEGRVNKRRQQPPR